MIIISSQKPLRITMDGGDMPMMFDTEVILSLSLSVKEKLNEVQRQQGANSPDFLLQGTFSMVAKGVPLKGPIAKIVNAYYTSETINMVVECAYRTLAENSTGDAEPTFELGLHTIHMFEETTLPDDMREELKSRYATHFKH